MPRGERSTTDPFSTLRTPEIISEPGLPLVSGKFAPMAQLFIAGRGSQARTSCRSGPNSFRSDKQRQADRQSLGTEVAISTPDTIKPGQDVVASYRYLGSARLGDGHSRCRPRSIDSLRTAPGHVPARFDQRLPLHANALDLYGGGRRCGADHKGF
jgi:hypothetical protein